MSRFRANPYARALHEVVLDASPDREEAVTGELEALARVVEEVPDFLRAMIAPTVPQEQKTRILDTVLDTLGILEPTRRFAHVLQRNYRLEHVAEIVSAYRARVDRRMGRVRVSVEVAGDLDAAARDNVVAVLARLTGSEVIAEFSQNPELLAGFRAQLGSKVFDGSLVGQLDQLRRAIASQPLSER